MQKVETFEVPRAPVKRTGRAVRGADRCFIDGVADTLMLDVSFIARRSITATAVDLCAMLSSDVARAAVLPINDHDSVRSAITAIALARCGRVDRSGDRSPHDVVGRRHGELGHRHV
ncbi:hypothetical protein [Burkholderia stabilis]|uniref:hypothetical protein n=1 Tax=Burkholderia stabilis TaxID=95485 RepID=UPI00159041B2|nr:hypothetical protein [Burkholderia stabilis]